MKTTIVTFNLEQFSEINSALDSYRENESYNVVVAGNLEEVFKSLETSKACIFIFSIQTKETFQGLVNIFKRKLKDIKSGTVKLAYSQISKNQKIENILRKFSCNDFLDLKTQKKSIAYKVDIWSRNVLANASKEVSVEEDKSNSRRVLQDKVRRSNVINTLEPLEEKFDIWLSPKNNCKVILAKWLVTFYGPSANISKWESVTDGTWKFVIDSEFESEFIKEDGVWFFEGLKPEFNWNDKMWSFSSSNFHLYFISSDDVSHTKAKWNFTDLDIKSNSEYANSLLPKIVESTRSNISVESDKLKESSDSKEELKGSHSKKEYLEADSKTDKINTNMTGESQAEGDVGGTYSGKLKEHSISEASGMEFKDETSRDKDFNGKGDEADRFSDLSGKLDNSLKDKENNEKNKSEKENDSKKSNPEIGLRPIKPSLDKEPKQSSSNDIDHKIDESSKADETKDSKRTQFNNKNESKEDSNSEMLDAMVNPSKNAVRVTYGSVAYLCDLVDFIEEELYVTLSGNQLEKEVDYSIVITMNMGKSKVSITTEGVLDSIDGEIYKLIVKKIPNSEYENFMSCFEERQDEINDFIQKARGF